MLSSAAGNDTITGDHGDDIITGGAGDDTIDAGTGHDVIHYTVGDGSDVVIGDWGTDRIEIHGVQNAASHVLVEDGHLHRKNRRYRDARPRGHLRQRRQVDRSRRHRGDHLQLGARGRHTRDLG